jgi:release factor glutamine methyltransferase
VRSAVDDAVRRLEAAGVDHPRREAMRLLAWLMETDRGGIVARGPDPIPTEIVTPFEALIARRGQREPFQYLVGEEEFCGLLFAVDRRVLVPRPETEIVVETVLSLPLGREVRALDVGTGSGCIATTLAVMRPEWSVVALDSSPEALSVTRANVERHRVEARVELVNGELSNLSAAGARLFDVVVSNPPYVSEDEWRALAPEVRDHEPKAALVPGPTGLEAYRALGPAAFRSLAPGGFLVLELGWRSEPGAREAITAAGFTDLEIRPDLRSIPRVLIARKKGTLSFSR